MSKILVCHFCMDPECDGRELISPDMYSPMGVHIGIKRFCRNHDDVSEGLEWNGEQEIGNGKFYYRVTSAHGCYTDFLLTPVEAPK